MNRVLRPAAVTALRGVRRGVGRGSVVFTLLLALLSISCTPAERVETVELWTDQPLIAFYVELYNAEQQDSKIKVRFKEDVAEAFLTEAGSPDIVIGRGLANRNLLPFVQEFSSLSATARSAIYPELLDLGRYGESLRFLPLSFNLPLVHFLETTMPGEAAPTIATEQLRELAAAFNSEESGRLRQVGFSPLWDTRFLLAWAQILGAGFTEIEELQVGWDQQALDRLVEEATAWRTETNGGGDAARAFEERYLYEPSEKLLRRGRIGFSFSTAGAYLSAPATRTEEMGFRWLAGEAGVPVLPEIVYAAVPSRSRHRQQSRRFIEWLLEPSTQERLMVETLDRNIDSFGFIEGFSSLETVNREIVPRVYPDLLGRVPPSHRLQFPRQTPLNWSALEREVLGPWLREAVRRAAETEPREPPTPLGAAIDQWYRARGL